MLPEEEPPERVAAGAPASPRTRRPQSRELELDRFASGEHRAAHRLLGAHLDTVGGLAGTRFATWAPHAGQVAVAGDFNHWDATRHPMRRHAGSGVWELFAPGVGTGARYRFEVRSAAGGSPLARPDPCGMQFDRPDSDVAVVTGDEPYDWQDSAWITARGSRDWLREPIAVYQVDLGAWRPSEAGRTAGYHTLAEEIAVRASGLGFTHLELLGATEPAGDDPRACAAGALFAPARRFGDRADFCRLIDDCHRHGLGVLIDWPAVRVGRSLARFDGQPLYEQPTALEDAALPATFDYSRGGVRSLLTSSALCWLSELHVDGLRVSSMASALYLDYARSDQGWIPNKYGGNENLDAIAFLRELTDVARTEAPGALLVAEESSAWPQVTRPPWVGGLGFSLRWSRGWVRDTLEYFAKDPVYRHYHHDVLTFSPLQAYRESYLLPLSHDDVVGPHGSLLDRMPGDAWQRYANLRLLYTYLWTHPGKKLLFMGGELGFPGGGAATHPVDWSREAEPAAAGLLALVRDLNRAYRDYPALHRQETGHRSFEWIDRHDAPQSIIAYLRREGDAVVVIALNFTPVPRHQYRIGVPMPGLYREVLNSDSAYYGGSNLGNMGDLHAEAAPWMGRPYSLSIVLPPLAGVVLSPVGEGGIEP